MFPGIKRSTRFCLLTLTGADRPFEKGIRFTFYARSLDQIKDPNRCVILSARDISLLNPNTKTCPVFQSRQDCELVRAIYRRVPVVVDESSGTDLWQLSIRRILDMNKSDILDLCLTSPSEGSEVQLAVYEAKLFDQMNHRGSTYHGSRVRVVTASELIDPAYRIFPRYWILPHDLKTLLPGWWPHKWLVVWQDVTDVNTMARTVSSAVLPMSGTDFTVRVGFSHVAPIDGALVFVSAFNSFIFDYVSRQKIGGTHLSDYILKQLPLPGPERLSERPAGAGDSRQVRVREWLLLTVLELTYTAWDLEPFAKDCGWNGPPFRWDDDRRFLLRCEVDAAFFHLYLQATIDGQWKSARIAEGAVRDETPEELAELKRHFLTPRDAMAYIMDTFPIVRRKDEERHGEYRTKRVILEIYDEMAEAMRTGIPYKSRLDPPPSPPSDDRGNFLPLPEWNPGQAKPNDWPPHIHPPKGCA